LPCSKALGCSPLDPKVLSERPTQSGCPDWRSTRPGNENSSVELAPVGRVDLGSLNHRNDLGRALSVVGDLVASATASPSSQNNQRAAISKLPHHARRGIYVEAPAHFAAKVLVDVGRRGHAPTLQKPSARKSHGI
jgi:hypothetical protein